MTKNELRTFMKTLPNEISYCNFRSIIAEKLIPLVRPKEWYYRWYGVFKDIKRGKL